MTPAAMPQAPPVKPAKTPTAITTIVKMPPASQEPSMASFENWPCQSMSSASSPGAELKGRGPRGRLAVDGGPEGEGDAAEAAAASEAPHLWQKAASAGRSASQAGHFIGDESLRG